MFCASIRMFKIVPMFAWIRVAFIIRTKVRSLIVLQWLKVTRTARLMPGDFLLWAGGVVRYSCGVYLCRSTYVLVISATFNNSDWWLALWWRNVLTLEWRCNYNFWQWQCAHLRMRHTCYMRMQLRREVIDSYWHMQSLLRFMEMFDSFHHHRLYLDQHRSWPTSWYWF